MTRYQHSLAVEQAGKKRLARFFENWSAGAPLIETEKDDQICGDYIVQTASNTILGVELKTVEGTYDKFFIELWSNRKYQTCGWLYTSVADRLVYHYQGDDRLFVMDMTALQRWLARDNFVGSFPECQQLKCHQLNDTWGALIPHEAVRNAIGFKWEGVAP